MNRAVAEARSWIGTPYVHQASVKDAGCDCLGLIRGVWRALYGAEPETVPPYSPDWDEPQGNESLQAAAERLFRPCEYEIMLPGQILLFRLREGFVAKHLGIVTVAGDAPQFVHAYQRHGVVESPLSRPWARRIVGRYAFYERLT